MNTRQLPCALTEDQIRERGIKLAGFEKELETIKLEKKAANASFKEKEEAINEEKAKLVQEINSRTEWRDVVVTEEKNYEKKEAYTIRTDTGEIVQTRALHPNEMQRPLPIRPSEAINQALEEVTEQINAGALDSDGTTVRATVNGRKKKAS